MDIAGIEEIEIDLLLEAVSRRYGYDYRNYARASVKRRLAGLLAKTPCQRLSEMIPLLLYDRVFFGGMVDALSVMVTDMFRDPGFYQSLRTAVVPYLQTYPFIKVWAAGCATGEEVYSLAILLREEGLYDRATIYATDINDCAVEQAKKGSYPLEHIKRYSANYAAAGGKGALADYYHAQSGAMIIDPALKANIAFASHNLVTDGSFGEMHLIICRNVLIYFDRVLQERVLQLFNESLRRGGFLCLGAQETLGLSGVEAVFEKNSGSCPIYQKRFTVQRPRSLTAANGGG